MVATARYGATAVSPTASIVIGLLAASKAKLFGAVMAPEFVVHVELRSSAMNASLKPALTNSGNSSERKRNSNERQLSLGLTGARRRSTLTSRSLSPRDVVAEKVEAGVLVDVRVVGEIDVAAGQDREAGAGVAGKPRRLVGGAVRLLTGGAGVGDGHEVAASVRRQADRAAQSRRGTRLGVMTADAGTAQSIATAAAAVTAVAATPKRFVFLLFITTSLVAVPTCERCPSHPWREYYSPANTLDNCPVRRHTVSAMPALSRSRPCARSAPGRARRSPGRRAPRSEGRAASRAASAA